MGRPRHSGGTSKKLLEEGLKAFLEHGYHGTGIKQILDRVNVPKGSFYNYFKSKEDFGAAVIEHYSGCFGEKMSSVLATAADPVAGLRKFFRGLMAEFEAANFQGGCLVGNLGGELEGSELCRQALSKAMRDWRNGVRDALRDAQEQELIRDDIPAVEMADLLIESWEGAVLRMKIDRSLKPLRQCLKRTLDDYFLP